MPLQSAALEALERLPRPEQSAAVFLAARWLYRPAQLPPRDWRPAQLAAGIEPLRRPYDLRHTYATFALRAGISIFDLSRFMGASLAMIDRHYGHLARDGREHAVALLDAFARETPRGRLVDAATGNANPLGQSARALTEPPTSERWTFRGRRPLRSVAWLAKKGASMQQLEKAL